MKRDQIRNRLSAPVAKAVDEACSELRTGFLADMPRREAFIIELLLREALMNAVKHGAAGRADVEIAYEVRFCAGAVILRVEDGGRGFNWQRWTERAANPLAESGRGLRILHRYADHVQFLGNGNAVEVTRRLAVERWI